MGLSVGRSRAVKNDINVTPLIDVVLVLLIIFLVTMPIMLRSITVEVPPEAPAGAVVPIPPLELLVRADLSVTIREGGPGEGGRETTVPATELASALRRVLDSQPTTGVDDRIVFVDAEDPVAWRDTVAAMDTIRGVASGAGGVGVAVKVRERPVAETELRSGPGQ